MGILSALKIGGIVAAVLLIAGSGFMAAKWRGDAKLAEVVLQLREAQRAAVSEAAARTAIQEQCAAGNAAMGDAADMAAAVRRAREQALREIDDAATTDDGDPLGAALRRLRERAAEDARGAGSAPDAPREPGAARGTP